MMRMKVRSFIVSVLILTLIVASIPMSAPAYAGLVGSFDADSVYDVSVGYSPETNQYLLAVLQTDADCIMSLGAQVLDDSGYPVGNEILIDSGINSDESIDIAYDSAADTYFITWIDYDVEIGSTVKGTILGSNGTTIMGSQVISQSYDYTETFLNAKVEYNAYSKMFNVIYRVVSEMGSYYAGVEVASDYLSESPFIIEVQGKLHDLAYNYTTKEIDLVYEEGGTNISHVSVASGGAISASTVLSENSLTSAYPAVASNNALDPYVVWHEYNSGDESDNLIGQTGGDPLTDTVLYTPSSESITDLGLLAGVDTQTEMGYRVAYWQTNTGVDEEDDYDIDGILIDGNGDPLSSVFAITSGTDNYTKPDAAYNSVDGTILFVYISEAADGLSSDIGFAFLDKNEVEGSYAGQLNFDFSDYPDGYEGIEGESVEITVTRDGGTSGVVTVDFTASVNTESTNYASSNDFDEISTKLTFSDGDDIPQVITIPLTDDLEVEMDEVFSISLSNPTGGVELGEDNAEQINDQVVIWDNDVEFSFEKTCDSIAEGDIASINLIRKSYSDDIMNTAQDVKVVITTGTALDVDLDISEYIQTIHFASGETSNPVSVSTYDDSIVESDETFTMTIDSVPLDAIIGESNSAEITIVDNDTESAGILNLCSSSYSIYENDETGIAPIMILRTGGTSGDISVDLTVTPVTATEADIDFTPLTQTVYFADGKTNETVYIPIIDDTSVEGIETIELVISEATSGAAIGTTDTAELIIYDDDYDQPIVNWSSSSYTVTEGQKTRLTVMPTFDASGKYDPSGYYFVEFEVTPDTATEEDYSVIMDQNILYDEYSGLYTVEITDETQSVDVYILAENDSVVEGLHEFEVSLIDNDDVDLGEIPTTTVTIEDTDQYDQPVVNWSSSSYTVTEGQETKLTVVPTFDASGKYDPSGYYFVEFEVTPDTATAEDYSVIMDQNILYDEYSGLYTVEITDETQSVDVYILAENDSVVEGLHEFEVSLIDNDDVDLGEIPTTTVTIEDTDQYDQPVVNWSSGTYTVTEGQETTLTVVPTFYASGQYDSSGYYLIEFEVSSDTATAEDYSVITGQDIWYDEYSGLYTAEITGETKSVSVNILAENDNLVEGLHEFKLSLIDNDDVDLGEIQTTTVTIEDTDQYDQPVVNWSSGTYFVTEGQEVTAEVEVVLDDSAQYDPSGSYFAMFKIESGTATTDDYSISTDQNIDYDEETGVYKIEVNMDEDTHTFDIVISTDDDNLVEGAHDFNITLLANDDIGLGEIQIATVTIEDNDEYDQPVINWSSNAYSVIEGQESTITVNYTLAESGQYNPNGYYIVEFEVTPNTATADDFSIETGQDIWYEEYADVYMTELSAEKDSLEIVVSTVDDSLIEGSHSFTVTLVDNSEVDLGTIPTATITIVDNDKSSSSSSSDRNTSSSNTTNSTTDNTADTPADDTPTADDATGAVDTAASDEEVSTANTVKDLTTAVTTKITSEETTTEEADEALKEIEDNLDSIQNDEVLSEALDSYIGTIETLGDAATQETKTVWATAKIIEMNATVSKALQKIEDSETLIATTTKMVESLKTIEAEGKVAKTADMKKAVEVLAKGAMNKLGTVKTATVTQEVDGVTEVSFADADLETKIAKSVENINKVKETFNDYYGGENIRGFGVEVTLETEKTGDAVKVKVDQKTLESLEKAGVDTVGIKVGGAKLLLDKDLYLAGGAAAGEVPEAGSDTGSPEGENQPEAGTRARELSIDMKFDSRTNGAGTATANFRKGYMADVNVSVDGEKKEVLEKPARLSFDLDEFEFFNDTAGPSSLSVYRLNEETGEWKPVGGVYDPVTNSISTRRISFSQYTVMQSNKSFNDVEDSWAKSEINELLNKGIIDEEVAFNPEESITREEFTTWVTRAYGLTNEDAEAPFSDIAQDSAHYVEVASAFNAGIVSGSSGSFNPDKAVTKEEMSAILANAMTSYDQKMLSEGIDSQLAQVGDGDLISDWAGDDVALLMELGVLELEEGNLNPKDTMTKEQAAAILKKIYG